MEKIVITTHDVCSRQVEVEYDENKIIQHVRFLGGCAGNTQGVASLLVGMSIEEAVKRLEGIKCRGSRGGETSCPNELAKGLKELLK